MKKFLTLILAVALVVSLAISTSAADFQGNGVIKMGTAVVDGQLDAAYTGSLYFTELGAEGSTNNIGTSWKHTAEASIYLMYDKDYLYIFAEVIDDDTFTKGPTYAKKDNPYVNDCIEFRLNFEGKDGGTNHKVSIDAYGFSCFGLKSAGSYDIIDYASLEFVAQLTDVGYNVEVAIPCSKGATNMIAAGKLGFSFQLNDINISGGHQQYSYSFAGEPNKICVFYDLSTEAAVPGTASPANAKADVTTEAPEETTKAPEETTKAPEETTKAPEETTKAPEETTKAPEETTKAPEETTKAPEETTKAPEETTKAPEETTKAPGETTEAPEETTEAPETFDPFVIAVALTAASGAAFVVASKKKH